MDEPPRLLVDEMVRRQIPKDDFIVLKEDYTGSKDLEEEIKSFVKTRLSKHEYPREIEFTTELPKTPDGKIKRKLLKEREKQMKA